MRLNSSNSCAKFEPTLNVSAGTLLAIDIKAVDIVSELLYSAGSSIVKM